MIKKRERLRSLFFLSFNNSGLLKKLYLGGPQKYRVENGLFETDEGMLVAYKKYCQFWM